MKLKLFCIITFWISILTAPFSIRAQNEDFKNKTTEELAKELANQVQKKVKECDKVDL